MRLKIKNPVAKITDDIRLVVSGIRPAKVCDQRRAARPMDVLESSKMMRRSLDAIFRPESIAVIGASEKSDSVGGSILNNLIKAEFAGRLSVVNIKRGEVQGFKAFGSVSELPSVPDLAIVCTPAVTVPEIIRECGRCGVGGAIIISSGFRETGQEGSRLEAELKEVGQAIPHLRFIGPNCLGAINPRMRLNASFSRAMPLPGRITLLSQSGALCTAILDWAIDRGIGFAKCVSVGNTTNVGIGDLIDYFANDEETEALLLYVEGLDDASRFMTAARRCSAKKPVIAYKAGRFAESSKAAASHTGAMASADNIYECAFRRAGVERANSIEELFDCAKLLVGKRHQLGPRLAIVTNAGGPGVMACDRWLSLGRHLAVMNEATVATLNQQLPRYWSHGNPIDILGDASVERYEVAIDTVLADPNVDSLLVMVTPQAMTQPKQIAHSIVKSRDHSNKQIIASFIGGAAVRSAREVLEEAGIPTYDFPEEAAQALDHLVSVDEMQAAFRQEQSSVAVSRRFAEDSRQLMAPERIDYWRRELSLRRGLFGEVRSKELLSEYGIPTVPSRIASNSDEVVAFAEQIGFPVVLKIVSEDISHKTDVGGVTLDIPDASTLRNCYEQMLQAVSRNCPTARIEGVGVQKMISEVRGIELLLGLTRDPQFGPVLLIGAGGVTAELQRDSVIEMGPFDERVVDRMLRKLRLYPLLCGYRGRPGVDLKGLQDVVVRFSQIAADFPEISIVELNPLLASADKIVALDARIIS